MATHKRQKIFIGVGLISIAIIAQQLALIRIFSNTQWYHFAFVVISVAMLGFGMAGTVLSLWRSWLLDRFDQVFTMSAIASGLSMCLIMPILNIEVLHFDSYLIFSDSHQVFIFLLNCLLLSLPFLFGALAIGIAFVVYTDRISRLYFYNLVGSALGGLLFLLLTWYFHPAQMPAVLALFPIAASLASPANTSRQLLRILSLLSLVVAIGVSVVSKKVPASEYKSLAKTMLLPNTSIIAEQNSPYGHIQVVRSSHIRHAPGLSLSFQGEVPTRNVVFNDGNWVGPVLSMNDSSELGQYTTLSLPYMLRRPGNVLALEAGSGESVQLAVEQDASHITATETNRALINVLQEVPTPGFRNVIFHPLVSLHQIEPRTFLATTESQGYDLIVLPIINVFGGASGTNAIQEQYLLTQEAFEAMWSRLNPGGMISLSCWIDYPSRTTLRVVSTLIELLESDGIRNVNAHLVAVKNWATITFCISKSPISAEEVNKVYDFCEMNSFDPVLLPNLQNPAIDRFNTLQDTSFYDYLELIASPGRDTFWSDYSFRVHPVSDDNPFFYQHLRLRNLKELLSNESIQPAIFMELGYLLVIAAFVIISMLAFVLIVLPLVTTKAPGSNWLWALIYFGGIGTGYMLVEIVFIHQFILYVGNAVFSTALVLTCLLLSSGAGSLLSTKIKSNRRQLIQVPLLIAGFLVFYGFLLTTFLQMSIGFAQSIKVVIMLLLIIPLGFLMGIPFPSAMSYLGRTNKETVPWAWGVNSYMSVVSTSAATICAVEFGFSWLFLTAAVAYGLVLLITLHFSPT